MKLFKKFTVSALFGALLVVLVSGCGRQTVDFIGGDKDSEGTDTSVNELLKRILFMTDSQSEVEYLPERAGDIRYLHASTDKLHCAGIRCNTNLAASLGSTINSYK